MVIERNTLVERNVVRTALAILNDGGGIAFDNADGMIIRNNLVLDISGNIESSAPNFSAYHPICHGIYFGNINIRNTLVTGNTVANCKGSGVHVDHTMVSSGNRIENNVLFNNTVQLSISDFSNYNGPGATAPFHVPAFNDIYTGNVLYCLTKEQLCMQQLHVYGNNWVDYGTFTNNYYFNPYNDRSIRLFNTFAGVEKFFTLERWRAERGKDQGSIRSPRTFDEFDVTAVLGDNLVPNGNFTSNVSGWSGWPTQGQLTHDQSTLDNGSLRVAFTNNASYNTFNLKHNALSSIQSGQWYRLKFSIVSSMHGEVLAGFKGQSQLSGPLMEGKRSIPFDGNRRDVSMIFQSTISDDGYCSFTNHYTEGIYNIDNIAMHRVQVEPLDPLEKQQLFYNAQATASTIGLDGCWSDVLGNLYTGNITLPPYASIVLVKEEDATCISTVIDDGAHSSDGAAFAYPNPVERGSTITFTAPSLSNATIAAYDMDGRIVWEEVLNGSAGTHVPSGLLPGTYIVQLNDGSQVIRQKLFVI